MVDGACRAPRLLKSPLNYDTRDQARSAVASNVLLSAPENRPFATRAFCRIPTFLRDWYFSIGSGAAPARRAPGTPPNSLA